MGIKKIDCSNIDEIIASVILCAHKNIPVTLTEKSCKVLSELFATSYDGDDACPFCGMAPMTSCDDDVLMYGCKNENCVCFDMPMVSEASWKYRPIETHLRITKQLDAIKQAQERSSK
jgi:hypothetical protein